MLDYLIRIRSWQWTLIGLAVGGFGALSVGLWGEPVLSAYGESINSRKEFEQALTRVESGRPWFADLVVQSVQVGDGVGARRTVHVVSGMYYDGRAETAGSGKAVWRPAFYVAEVPYHPATSLATLPGGGEAARRFDSLPQPTVLDFLGVMARAKGVSYTHAWWRSPANARAAWLLVGIVGVGVVWPLALNLSVFGSIRRPKEQGADLRNVSTATAGASGSDADKTAAMNKLEEVIDEMLESADADAPPVALPPTGDLAKPSVRTLETRPLEPIALAGPAEHKEFGAAEEDYYPTEIKAAKGKVATTRKA